MLERYRNTRIYAFWPVRNHWLSCYFSSALIFILNTENHDERVKASFEIASNIEFRKRNRVKQDLSLYCAHTHFFVIKVKLKLKLKWPKNSTIPKYIVWTARESTISTNCMRCSVQFRFFRFFIWAFKTDYNHSI